MKLFVYVSLLERGLGGVLGMGGGWPPLPTHPQRYCEPTTLVNEDNIVILNEDNAVILNEDNVAIFNEGNIAILN